MPVPVGTTTSAFIVSVATFGGCGLWWQCGIPHDTLAKNMMDIMEKLPTPASEAYKFGSAFTQPIGSIRSESCSQDVLLNEVQSTIVDHATESEDSVHLEELGGAVGDDMGHTTHASLTTT
jgi:hypothetical protein